MVKNVEMALKRICTERCCIFTAARLGTVLGRALEYRGIPSCALLHAMGRHPGLSSAETLAEWGGKGQFWQQDGTCPLTLKLPVALWTRIYGEWQGSVVICRTKWQFLIVTLGSHHSVQLKVSRNPWIEHERRKDCTHVLWGGLMRSLECSEEGQGSGGEKPSGLLLSVLLPACPAVLWKRDGMFSEWRWPPIFFLLRI